MTEPHISAVASDAAGDADFVTVDDGDTLWRFERSFITSNWTCIFGRGCKGILAEPSEHLNQGCCSVGAELVDLDESNALSANAATLRADHFQFHAEAAAGGIYRDAERLHTRLVDGACIFLNRPGFAGGEGCALHIGALHWNESPIEWKPSVCWELPLRLEFSAGSAVGGAHAETATIRRWARDDWGDDADHLAWCCTDPGEAPEAFSGDRLVLDSLAEELTALVGEPVYVRLRQALRPSLGGDIDEAE